MQNKLLIIASVLGLLSVAMGAFGAHALKGLLDADALMSYETGVRYMMYHALAVLFINGSKAFDEKSANTISYFFLAGITFFSGSIFAISVGAVEAKSIWFITPLGGLMLIVGWLLMIFSLLKKNRK